MAGSNETRSPRPYVVLEEQPLRDLLADVLRRAGIELGPLDSAALENVELEADDAYIVVMRPKARNGRHATDQAARLYDAGKTPPLVGIPERQWKPTRLDVTMQPRVSRG